ncbi:MAG: LysM peptidoglycan-binding domain-containing protein [Planctomycetota bacterium]|nr:LysM peptidoglycan-binding domain-containing protein [Planctomycetota bacterium]
MKKTVLGQPQDHAWTRESMTRENKLALIVGFGLVLFMGILVSDHLSTARRQSAAAFELGSGLNRTPVIPGNGWLVYGDTPPEAETSAPRLQAPEPPTAPVPSDQEIPIADTRTHSPHHVVASGDTLQSICQRHYGDRTLDQALARYNRIANPHRLTTNTRLLLPSVDVLLERGSVLQSAPASQATTVTMNEAAPTEAASTMGQYTIQSGDTLSELAQRLLGSARETERLYELNRDVLSHQDDLRVGASLRYPLAP